MKMTSFRNTNFMEVFKQIPYTILTLVFVVYLQKLINVYFNAKKLFHFTKQKKLKND